MYNPGVQDSNEHHLKKSRELFILVLFSRFRIQQQKEIHDEPVLLFTFFFLLLNDFNTLKFQFVTTLYTL